jgi:hypothetical protein
MAQHDEQFGNSEQLSQQSAVEWFYIKIHEMYNGNTDLHFDLLLEQAKEMEKKQIIKFANDYLDDDSDMNVEEFYTKTYGTRLQNETNSK